MPNLPLIGPSVAGAPGWAHPLCADPRIPPRSGGGRGSAHTKKGRPEGGLESKCFAECRKATRCGVAFLLKEVRRCPTLPQGPPCSTIGAVRLSFRVRNVTGRFPHAMAAETLLTCNDKTNVLVVLSWLPVRREPQSGRKHQERCVIKSSAY